MAKMMLFLCGFVLNLSVAAGDIRSELLALYPDQSAALLEQRIATVQNPFGFFRSFSPYFYQSLEKDVLARPPWLGMKGFQAWCVGDAHPENFGVLLSLQKQPIFTINDSDDANPCPLVADVFRLVVSWSFMKGQFAGTELIKAYVDGLQVGARSVPRRIQMLQAEGVSRGLMPPSKWVGPDGGLRRRKDLLPVPPAQETEVRAQAQKLAGSQWSIREVKERLRFEGGSGGQKRFLILLGSKSFQNQSLLIEFKQVAAPATFPLKIPIIEPVQRLKTAWLWEQGPAVNSLASVFPLLGKVFFSRALFDGNLGLKLDQISSLEMQEISLYQASLLGALHRTGGASKEYQSALSQITSEQWIQSSAMMGRSMTEAYQRLGK